MYKFIVIIFVLFTLSSCVKENTPTAPVNNPVDTSMANIRFNGTFGNGPYGAVNGTAKIYFQNNQYILALENFSSSNGPDLHVYISKELQPVNYIDLGKLQAVSGNQQYQLTENISFSEYKYALIHCQQYNHLFGSADLK
ncbi:MAG TPA: DM13 domain-containing protein [Chitinophagaceae bacterium]|nr:DM13 domain-containing protein [Chitinophagaceae bacterium]